MAKIKKRAFAHTTLKEYRVAAGLSIAEAARQITTATGESLSRQLLHDYEKGRSKPSLDRFREIADFYSKPMESFYKIAA